MLVGEITQRCILSVFCTTVVLKSIELHSVCIFSLCFHHFELPQRTWQMMLFCAQFCWLILASLQLYDVASKIVYHRVHKTHLHCMPQYDIWLPACTCVPVSSLQPTVWWQDVDQWTATTYLSWFGSMGIWFGSHLFFHDSCGFPCVLFDAKPLGTAVHNWICVHIADTREMSWAVHLWLSTHCCHLTTMMPTVATQSLLVAWFWVPQKNPSGGHLPLHILHLVAFFKYFRMGDTDVVYFK